MGYLRRAGLALAVIVGVAASGAGSASATAGAPILLATSGQEPQVVVDSQGMAHIVWSEAGAAADAGVTQYCAIPAGASACIDRQSFSTPWFGASRVLLGPSPGEIVILHEGENGEVDAWVSMDGGQSFSAGPNGSDGVIVGKFSDGQNVFAEEQPAFGPGGFSASWINAGGDFATFPLNDPGPVVNTPTPPDDTPLGSQLLTGCGFAAPTGVALLNGTTPVAECEDIGSGGATGTIDYRVATGEGDINDVSTGSWGPVQQVTGLSNDIQLTGARLAAGARGVFLLYDAPDGSADVRQLVDGSFGPPTVVAAHTFVEGFSEDATGNLYAVTQDGPTGSGSRAQRVFTSPDGVNWTEVPLDLGAIDALADNAPYGEIAGCAAATGASSTGSGVIALEPDAPGYGAVYAESFGDSPCGTDEQGAACPTHLTVGEAQLVATTGCFAAGPHGTYTTSGQVELNGLMIDPSGALTLDTVNRTVVSSAPAAVHASSIELWDRPLDWLLPADPGPPLDLADHGSPVAFDPSALGSTMLGFTIGGSITPGLEADGEISLPLNVETPAPVGGIIGGAPTDDLHLTTGNFIPGGIDLGLGSVDIKLPEAWLGIAELSPFELSYDADPDVFDGNIGLKFPVIDSSLTTHFRFQQGRFVEGDATGDFGMALPVFTDVFLQKVNFHIAAERGNVCAEPADDGNGPSSIGGGVTLALGPIVGGNALATVAGDATYTFPESSCHRPGTFAITGSGSILGVPVANDELSFTTDPLLVTFGASVALGSHLLGIFANVQGGVSVANPPSFYLTGSANVYVGGIEFGPTITVSSIGVGACLSPVGYIEYHWGGSVSGQLFTFSCDMGDLTPQAFQSSARPAGKSIPIRIPRHDPVAGIRLTGTAGAPLVALTGPSGQRITTPAAPVGEPAALTTGAAADIIVSPSQDTTFVKLLAPTPGRWEITPLPGSPAITDVATARGLPTIAVRAKVRATRGRDRLLVFRQATAQGRSVTFLERNSHGLLRRIAASDRAHGEIRFDPAPAQGGRRTILAQTVERGMTDGKPIAVATYTAPGPPTLRRPGHVTVTRARGAIRVRWQRVPGAVRYVIRVMLADGRALLILKPASTDSVTVAAVSSDDGGRIMIAALDATSQPGPIASARLRRIVPDCPHPRSVRGTLSCGRHKPARPHHKPARSHRRHHR